MLYDTHAHLDDTRLYTDLEQVLARAKAAGLGFVNTVGCDWKSSLMAVRLAERWDSPELRLFAVVGIHPSDAESMTPELLERLKELAAAPHVVAWGEIGLDYHYPTPDREIQQMVFAQQLAAAKEVGLPVVIHDRESHQDVLDLLRAEKTEGGVMHCFSGSKEMARECLNMGFYLSFAGPLTYHNARHAPEVAAYAPLDRLLVETDCPYLSPEPFRGKQNEPAKVAYTLAKLAEIRGLPVEEMARITTENARRVFRPRGSAV